MKLELIVPKLPLLGPANLTDLNEGILSNMEDATQNIKQVSIAVCHIPELSDEGLQLFMVIPTDVYCSCTRTLHATIRTSTHPYLRTIHNIFPVSSYIKIYIQGLSKRFEHLLFWPPRSPDLTPCDFFLWGYVKDNAYKRQTARSHSSCGANH